MPEHKIKRRRPGAGIPAFTLVSIGFVASIMSLVLFVNPISLYIVGVSAIVILLVVWRYKKTPMEEVYIFKKIDKNLYFTSLNNPENNFSGSRAISVAVSIDDIVCMTIYRQHMYQARSYIFIAVYLSNAAVYPIWLEIEYEESVLEVIYKILEEQEDIKVYCPDLEIYNKLSVFGDRAQNSTAPPIDEIVTARVSYRDKFNDEEWQLLLDAPIRIFLFIAKGDGVITKKELKKLTSYLHSSQSQRSLLFSEILHAVAEEINEVQFDYYESDFCRKMTALIAMVSMKVDKNEVGFLKAGLVDYAYGIARADNPKEEVPAMTEYKLKQMQTCLKM